MNGKTIRVCLLGASLDTGNLGVSALASGAVTAVLSSFPQAEIFVLDYAKDPAKWSVHCAGGDISVELCNIRFSKRVFLPNNVARLLLTAFLASFLSRRRKARLLDNNQYLKRILEADIIGSIGGGDSFSDIYGLSRLLYVALPQVLVLQLGKPLILLPQTLGPFRSAVGRAIGRHIMGRAAAVFARDRMSLEEAEHLLGGKQDKLKLARDMAFVVEPVRPEEAKLASLPRRDGSTPLIGLNISGLLLMGGYNRANMFRLKVDYRRLLGEIVDYFVRQHRANVLLVPHVLGDSDESDAAACARIFEQLHSRHPGQIHLLRGEFDQHEVKYLIGQCDFFIGSRMHACIAALSQSVPAVCLAYSRKFVGVLESIGCSELTVDACVLDNAEVLACIGRLFAARIHLRSSLMRRMPEVRQGILRLFSLERLGIALNGSRHPGANEVAYGACRGAENSGPVMRSGAMAGNRSELD